MRSLLLSMIVYVGFYLFFRSTFDDWRPHLGLLLQSIPFPDEALTHDRFIEYVCLLEREKWLCWFNCRLFKNVVKNFVEDSRCEVHQTVLGIREGKEGWFEMFCLGGIACDDDGEMFSLMVKSNSFKFFVDIYFLLLAQ